MKNSFILSGLVFLSMTGIAHAAKSTDIKVSNAAIEITGAAPQGTKISAIVVYVPDNANSSACQFEEDKYSPNGPNVMYPVDGSQNAQGIYSLKLPLAGLRKDCKYSFHEVYLAVEKGGVYESLHLNSDAKVAEDDAFAEQAGIDKTILQDFEAQKEMYCDLASDVGLCQINGTLPDMAYHVSTSEHKVQFDIKDLAELPQ